MSTLSFSVSFVPIQQQAHIFRLPFAVYVFVESPLAALQVPCQITPGQPWLS